MSGSAIVEVIIGMVFVYILLSLLVSQINSVIANALSIRAKQLRERVEDIVFDPEVRQKVLTHPVIGLLVPPKNALVTEADELETAKVSNLPPATFAKAMINVLSDPYLSLYAAIAKIENPEEKEYIQSIVNQLKANVLDPTRANAVLARLHEAFMSLEPADRPDRKALLGTLGALQNSIRNIQSGNSGLLQILDGVSRIENPAFQQAMETVLGSVQTVKEAEAAIEEWFDNKMSQTKDMYGHTMQYMSLFVGLVIAVILNIDSLYLAQTLWNDPAVRERVSVAARAANDSGVILIAPAVDEQGNPTGTEMTPTQEEQLLQSYQQAEATLQTLIDLRLPIGWNFRPPSAENTLEIQGIEVYDPTEDPRNLYNLIPFATGDWLVNWINKIAGLGMTSIAVAQGAPFWFDMLRRLSGQKSPSSTENAS